jgi:protoporphyrinogen oxidase
LRLGSRNGEGKSFDDVMKKAFGTAAYEDLIRPYSEKFWKVSPELIDAEVAKMRVSAGGLKKLIRQVLGRENEVDPSALLQFHYLPGGFHDIVLKFERSFANDPVIIHKNARVTGLFPTGNDGVRVKFALADAQEKHETFDFCFSTIPLDDLVKMLTQTVPNESALHVADNLRFVSMILVYLVAKKPQISDNSWLYFPEKHLIFNRAYESKNFNPRWKTDNSVLCLEVTCHRGDELWTRSDADIADQVVKQFCSTGMLNESEVDKTVVVRLTHAYPLLTRGYQEKLQVLWRYLSTVPSIISLGRQGLFQHNNTDHAMYMGFRAADLFRRSPSPAQEWYQSEINRFKNFRIVD